MSSGLVAVIFVIVFLLIAIPVFFYLFNQTRKMMRLEMENLMQKLLEDNSQRLTSQNDRQLTQVLEPFRDRLKDFEKRVEDFYSTERSERGSLKGELSKLLELNVKMSTDAQSLASALKGNNKMAGNWGEMLLEGILEQSGLRKGVEYITQGENMKLTNQDGTQIRPDVIIMLPDNKHIVVDSKLSLLAYEAYSRADSDLERDQHAKAHVESLKRHIEGLSQKKYHTSENLSTPDFVMLFMPLEPAFALAFKYRPDLLEWAWARNIALVSPTTLLTTLKTVAVLWRTDRQEKNALEIAKRGGALYDKFAALLEDFDDLGKKLDQTKKSHESIRTKLSEGSGNLIRQVEMLRELGAKTDKRLPAPKDN